jgi:hypothetical protein
MLEVVGCAFSTGGMALVVGDCGGKEGARVDSIGLLTVDGINLLVEAPLVGAAGLAGVEGAIVGWLVGGCGARLGGDIGLDSELITVSPSQPHDWQPHGSLTTTLSHPHDWQGEEQQLESPE